LNRPYEELVGDRNVLEFLSNIGPDAMVNSFAVNIKGNKDHKLASKLQNLVFQRLSYTNTKGNQERVPIYITETMRDQSMGQEALDKYKARMGLPPGPDPFSFLIATCLNPWETTNEHLRFIRGIFRDVVFAAIGELKDDPDHHSFVVAGPITDDGYLYGDYLTNLHATGHQYQAIVKMKISCQESIKRIQKMQESTQKNLFFKNKDLMTLPGLMRSAGKRFTMEVCDGTEVLLTVDMILDDAIRIKTMQSAESMFPEKHHYWMFGDEQNAYLSHVMHQEPEFQQVVRLAEVPKNITPKLIQLGFQVNIPSVQEACEKVGEDGFVNPLPPGEYEGEFIGVGGKLEKMRLKIENESGNVYLDSNGPNNDLEVAKRPETTTSDGQSINYDVSVVTDKADKEMYFAVERKSKDLKLRGMADPPAEPGALVTLKNDRTHTYVVDCVLPNKQMLGVRETNGRKAIVVYNAITLL